MTGNSCSFFKSTIWHMIAKYLCGRCPRDVLVRLECSSLNPLDRRMAEGYGQQDRNLLSNPTIICWFSSFGSVFTISIYQKYILFLKSNYWAKESHSFIQKSPIYKHGIVFFCFIISWPVPVCKLILLDQSTVRSA